MYVWDINVVIYKDVSMYRILSIKLRLCQSSDFTLGFLSLNIDARFVNYVVSIN